MSALSEKALGLSVAYLGPAAKVFLERQTKFHLDGLAFDDLQPQHLPDLARWVAMSGKMVIDESKAKELADKIAALG